RTVWPTNSESTEVATVSAPRNQPLFRFLRYDIKLEQAWLARGLGVKIEEQTLTSYRMIDASENIPAIYELGARGAERQMTRDHLASVRCAMYGERAMPPGRSTELPPHTYKPL